MQHQPYEAPTIERTDDVTALLTFGRKRPRRGRPGGGRRNHS